MSSESMDTTELRKIVNTFRVQELTTLLGYAGRNKTGRKTELLAKALGLVSPRCDISIQMKIMELAKKRAPHIQAPASRSNKPMDPNLPPAHPGAAADYYSSYRDHHPSSSSHHRGHHPYLPQGGPGGGAMSGFHHHQVPVLTDVSLKPLAFYDPMGEIMKPSTLGDGVITRYQEKSFFFHLTPQQIVDINASKTLSPDGQGYCYRVQIQLRFCLAETTCAQDDAFPSNLSVRVNNKMITLPAPKPTNKPGMEPKRPPSPVDITDCTRLTPTVANTVFVSWSPEYGKMYCCAINLVCQLTSAVLLQRLKQKGTKDSDHTRAMIKDKMRVDTDSEIATTSLRCSLMCPLGKMKMSVPARGTNCTHIQPFDAATYLMMNERKPTWLCPVCDKAAGFTSLFLDGLFEHILRANTDAAEIQFGPDGSWTLVKDEDSDNDDDDSCDSFGGRGRRGDVRGDDTHVSVESTPSCTLSSDDDEIEVRSSVSAPRVTAPASAKSDFVDLTIDSSEDEDDVPAQISAIPTISHKAAPELPSAQPATASSKSSSAALGHSSAQPPFGSSTSREPVGDNLLSAAAALSSFGSCGGLFGGGGFGGQPGAASGGGSGWESGHALMAGLGGGSSGGGASSLYPPPERFTSPHSRPESSTSTSSYGAAHPPYHSALRNLAETISWPANLASSYGGGRGPATNLAFPPHALNPFVFPPSASSHPTFDFTNYFGAGTRPPPSGMQFHHHQPTAYMGSRPPQMGHSSAAAYGGMSELGGGSLSFQRPPGEYLSFANPSGQAPPNLFSSTYSGPSSGTSSSQQAMDMEEQKFSPHQNIRVKQSISVSEETYSEQPQLDNMGLSEPHFSHQQMHQSAPPFPSLSTGASAIPQYFHSAATARPPFPADASLPSFSAVASGGNSGVPSPFYNFPPSPSIVTFPQSAGGVIIPPSPPNITLMPEEDPFEDDIEIIPLDSSIGSS